MPLEVAFVIRKFSDFYRQGRFRFSLEIFPPKTDSGVVSLFAELQRLNAVDPAFVSVTYGAMGSTRGLTRDLVLKIRDEIALTTAFHFTCVGFGHQEIRKYVTDLAKQGINLVVALRGDIPQKMHGHFTPPADGFRYASELVGYLRGLDGFSIAVAGYPEKHIEATSFEADLENLKRKVDAGADIILTQLFFNNDHYYSYLERVRKLDIHCPVVPGILPIQNLRQVKKIAALCGASLPKKLFQDLEKFHNDSQAMMQIGLEHATRQCRDLITFGVPGIHFYSLNKADAVLGIVGACCDLIRAG